MLKIKKPQIGAMIQGRKQNRNRACFVSKVYNLSPYSQVITLVVFFGAVVAWRWLS